LLARLDKSIAYITAHPQYKDSATYLARFKQCQNRAMTLVKLHVVNTLKSATHNVLTQVQGNAEETAGPEASFTLFYGRFRMHAPRIKALMSEIEARGATNEDYSALLEECYGCYASQRSSLLIESVRKRVATIMSENINNLPHMTRTGCAYMVRMCSNEQQLYDHFFSSTGAALFELLESLATVLYEALRPLFIASTINLDNLVELCSVLKSEVSDHTAAGNTPAFLSVAEQMLQDVQQRLAFRTQAYTQSDITGYMPSPSDLDYPKKLTVAPVAAAAAAMPAAGAAGVALADGAVPPAVPPSPTKAADGVTAMTETWYPTLPHTLLLLSKLYRSVERGVFEGLAQELVYGCLESLVTGYTSISKLKGSVHGQLFLIKHLLILRDQIAPFEGSFSARETNVDFAGFFTGLRTGLQDLVSQRDKLFSFTDNSFLGFLVNSTPQVLETHSDSRELMDQRLKAVCTEYIQFQVKETCGKIASFLVMVDAMAADKRASLGGHANTTAEKTRGVVVEFDKVLRSHGGVVKEQLTTYLDNAKTEQIIMASIKNGVLDVYQKFLIVVTAGYSAEDAAIISPPTIEQVRMTFG
jgi:hypothetical protein